MSLGKIRGEMRAVPLQRLPSPQLRGQRDDKPVLRPQNYFSAGLTLDALTKHHSGKSSACLPWHVAVVYLYLVRLELSLRPIYSPSRTAGNMQTGDSIVQQRNRIV